MKKRTKNLFIIILISLSIVFLVYSYLTTPRTIIIPDSSEITYNPLVWKEYKEIKKEYLGATSLGSRDGEARFSILFVPFLNLTQEELNDFRINTYINDSSIEIINITDVFYAGMSAKKI
jgi:hypothetical protein